MSRTTPVASGRSAGKLTVALAATSAVTAANVYLSQPLLGAISESLDAAPGVLGALPTATQLGYAAGILLVVPTGDTRDRRKLILRLGTASAIALIGCALAPTVWWLITASLVVGLLSAIPQLVTPLAVALAEGRSSGRVIGAVQAGLLVGVLASRAYSGALADLVGWRGVYVCSSVLTLTLMAVLARMLPSVPPTSTGTYRAALGSLPRLAVQPLVWRVVSSATMVGVAFGAFWTTLTFLLAEQYEFGSTQIGLFGLVAAASAIASPWAGRLADRAGRFGAMIALIGLVIVGWLVLIPGETNLWWLVVGVIVLDIGVWGNQAACQALLFTLDPATHNRLNTVYFTLRFLGIAAGSMLGPLLWVGGGWSTVAFAGAVAALAGLVLGVLPLKRPQAQPR
ncbi:MFS transporter [Saccharomonospora sp. NPDC006951]